jgi:segregation and condensation protein A
VGHRPLAQRLPITVRLESFEGPLDLLLYLIQSHELDINRVSIGRITDQYLTYVRLMQELNFDTASEFLVMAATLLHWKSKSLLPEEKKNGDGTKDEDAPLTQEELIRQLLEHQRFLEAGARLAQLPKLGEDVFVRPNRRPPVERVWREMSITDLAMGYQEILIRARKRTTILRKETVSLADKIVEFKDRLKLGKMTEFRSLLSALASRPEIVVTFLATLEMARLKKMRVHQEQTYGDILVELIQSLEGFDLHLASGFDAPNPVAQVAAQIENQVPGPRALDPNSPDSAEQTTEPALDTVPSELLTLQQAEILTPLA